MRSLAAARSALLPLILAAATAGAALATGTDSGPAHPTAPQERGRSLAAELGCGGCHAGVPDAGTIQERAPAFGPDAPALAGDFVFTYLADPVRRRDDIGASRMPDFRLDEAERVALALFLAPDGATAQGELAAARNRHPKATAELGGRIFTALGCAGCHTGVVSAQPVQAPDLSREGARTRAGWLSGFLREPRAIRGDGHPTLGAARMPDFRLTDDEASDLAAYLQAMGSRFATLDTTALTPFEERRTHRLLEDRAACLGCHRIDGEGGRIGPSLEDVASRRPPSFILETILDPQRATPGSPMPHQPLQPREATRVARYLLAHGRGAPAAPQRASLADVTNPAWATATVDGEGAPLYGRHCVACHGSAGGGDGWNAPNLPVPPAVHADSARMSARVDDALFDGISAGAWVLDGSPRMPAFGDLLKPGEIRTLVGYIRTLCRCSAPTWSADGSGGGA